MQLKHSLEGYPYPVQRDLPFEKKLTTFTTFDCKTFEEKPNGKMFILQAEVYSDERYWSKFHLYLHYRNNILTFWSEMSTVRSWFWNFPEVMDNLDNFPTEKHLIKLGFTYREPSVMELVVNNGSFWRGRVRIEWKELEMERLLKEINTKRAFSIKINELTDRKYE